MSLGNIGRQVLVNLTITGCTLLTLVTGMVHADSKANAFPNPNVPYRIPLGESLKKQAKYLFAVVKQNNYSQLERQLRRYVPELRRIDKEDIEPLDDIVTLAVTATNPEVREAFDLMIKGGRRGWGFNTELQILFWLAEQKEFKKNDTLAMAMAMVNGLWVTMGTKEVKEAVRKDGNQLLGFFRQTSDWQKRIFDYDLEDYPLEAKILLAWTGNYSPIVGRNYSLKFYRNRKLPLAAYHLNNVSVRTLEKIRGVLTKKGWLQRDVGMTFEELESLFSFGSGRAVYYTSMHVKERYLMVHDKKVINHDMTNPDFLFEHYSDKGYIFGDCGDQTTFINALSKSVGIATGIMAHQNYIKGSFLSHFFSNYYDPLTRSWKAYEGQLNIRLNMPDEFFMHIFVPPVNQKGYLKEWMVNKCVPLGNMKYTEQYCIREIKRMFTEGVPTSQMKKWLLY